MYAMELFFFMHFCYMELEVYNKQIFRNLESLKAISCILGERFYKNSKGYKTPKSQLNFKTAHFIFRTALFWKMGRLRMTHVLRYTEDVDVVFTKNNGPCQLWNVDINPRVLCDSSNLYKQIHVKPKTTC